MRWQLGYALVIPFIISFMSLLLVLLVFPSHVFVEYLVAFNPCPIILDTHAVIVKEIQLRTMILES